MEKKEFLEYLKDKEELIENLKIYPRELKVLKTKRAVVTIIGPRRSGKTYYLYNIMKEMKNWVYVNFEDTLFSNATPKDILNVVRWYKEFYGRNPEALFFDEIQNVEGWEKAVRELYESKRYYIFVTGSSSKLLSKEIATSLRGRSIRYYLLPLSFNEYLKFKEFKLEKVFSSDKKSEVKHYLREYLKYGGFPDVVLEESLFRKFFESYIDLVVFKDIGERYNIRNLPLLRYFIKKVISSFSSKISIHKIYLEIKAKGMKVSKKTLYSYMEYLKDCIFAFTLRKFSKSFKKVREKLYLVDNGIATFYYEEDFGRKMENCVFLHLLRKAENENAKLFYFENGGEIDFLYFGKVKYLINVCKEITYDNYKREVFSLIKGGKELKVKNLIIVSEEGEGEIKEGRYRIKQIPLYKFLIGGNF